MKNNISIKNDEAKINSFLIPKKIYHEYHDINIS